MRRGTTPTHIFKVDIDTASIKEIKITYSQNDKIVLVKRTDDCTMTPGEITLKLTQEETFKFDYTDYLYIQIRILMIDGECLSTDLIMVSVKKCLDNEVLS